ncbi:hypothetical protein LguiB_013006 [Lonicera macranthoides]
MVCFPEFRYLRKLEFYEISEGLDYFPWPSSSTSTTCDHVAVEENDDDDIQPWSTDYRI